MIILSFIGKARHVHLSRKEKLPFDKEVPLDEMNERKGTIEHILFRFS